LTSIYNYYIQLSSATFYTQPFTIQERRLWFEGYSISGPYRLVVMDVDSNVVGFASSSPLRSDPAFRHSIETSIYLAPTVLHRGYGTMLYRYLFEELAREDLHRAYAGIVLPNEASIKFHRLFGFREIGIFSEYATKWGQFWSSVWMEKDLQSANPRRK